MRFIPLLLLLGACATTPASIRKLPPKAAYSSAKSEAALEQCLAERFAYRGGPSIVRGPGLTSLSFGSGGIVSLIIDIAPPTVTVRSGYMFAGKERAKLEACL